ncbi:MAG: MBOAT family protein [Halieaceae bacterium]
MLFISHIYICLFLPLCLLVFHLLVRHNRPTLSVAWLVSASLFFYGWWNPQYLVLILTSVFFNYGMGELMSRYQPRRRKDLLLIAILGNVGLLGYFKYANFLVLASNQVLGTSYHLETIILPLAISFFTLQQIAYVVDAYRGDAKHYNFLRYSLFVTFFPQLIAGPIVHHRKLVPQFAPDKLQPVNADNLALGLSIFFAGMFKKVAIADQLIPWVAAVYDAPGAAIGISLDSWIATYAYTFQLYFDFSGYSDMAIGAAMMFNIKLPINFNSPYKAANIREIWRHWHITLSDFVMRYVYAPLGANKLGPVRGYRNLFIAFLVTGIWHGAGWTFVIFGCLHGLAVMLHQGWKDLGLRMPRWLGIALTFNFWALALVIFRAPNMEHALLIYQRMFSLDVFATPGYEHTLRLGWLCLILAAVWLAPNTSQIFRIKPARDLKPRWQWQPSARWGLLMGAIAVVMIFRPIASLTVDQAFIYFQF